AHSGSLAGEETTRGKCYTPLPFWRLQQWEVSMKQHVGMQVLVVVALALSSLLASQSIAYASGVSVSGGGIVSGDLGTTSQLGFTASSSGGEFLCVMAGRSGGFTFGPWGSVVAFHVLSKAMEAHSARQITIRK